MNESPFLSIVIPVYNGAACISRCLDSIWRQEMDETEYEVICVDDCSTDNTMAVLENIQNQHGNMHILSNISNLRAGGSRNHGVRAARGKYVCFIDADDYYHNGALSRALSSLKKYHLDILVCDFARHTENTPNDALIHQFPNSDVMPGREFMVVNSLPYAPWKYLFRKSLMIEHGIWFEECVSCEDVDWTHKMAFFADRMKYDPILLVHYILMPSSQTATEYKRKETVYHRLFCGYRLAKLITYCQTAQEKYYISSVAEATCWNGILFLSALFTSPIEKNRMIRKYLEGVNGKRVNIIKKYSLLYSWCSTFFAPVFRSLIILKRKFGR